MTTAKFDYIGFIKRLISFSPRQYGGEMKTADFLEDFLQKRHVRFFIQKFNTTVPVEKQAVLKLDGKKISCKSTCFVGGKISGKDNLVSSLSDFDENYAKYNINFNPYCSGISCASFYNHPAVAVSHADLNKILKAKKVEGSVKVKPTSYTARNILVGNKKNPEIICFAHYDSISKGAWDNASGVSVIMANIILYPQTLRNTLYVFTANEELSYDKKPAYWCRGFRCFEKTYLNLFKKAKKIIVVDGVGISPSYWMTKYENLQSTIFIENLKKFMPKIKRLGASTSKFAQHLYHSDWDDASQIKMGYLLQTTRQLNKEITKK